MRPLPVAAGCSVLAAVLAAALAACSSSTSGHGSATPPTHAQLQAMNLQQADLPAGWTGSAPDGGNDPGSDAKLAACVGISTSQDPKIEEVDSDDFSDNDNSISSSATSYKEQSQIQGRLAILTSPKADNCFATSLSQNLTQSLPSGSTVDSTKVHITKGTGGGPSNVVATMQAIAVVTVQGQTVNLYLTNWLLTGVLVGASVQFEGIGTPIDSALQTRLVGLVSKRVGNPS